VSQAAGLSYRPGLGPAVPLAERLGAALERADRFEFAVAYAKSSGVGELLGLRVPQRSRAVVGLGFGLSDPHAIERLDDAGVEVRCAIDASALESATFHPKLYLASRAHELVVLSGSANLTGGGLRGNVEQYEELRFGVPSEDADVQQTRFEALWEYGAPLGDLRRSGDWDDYIERAKNRRRLEQDDRRRLARLNASTGRLLGQLARRDTRRAPGFLGITHPDWWALQLLLRDRADRALFWRRNTNAFKALAHGGLFFHLVKHPSGDEELRSVAGSSTYPGLYEVGRPEDLWRRYGQLLGVHAPGEIYERLTVTRGRPIGVIHLEQLTELDRPVPLAELRVNRVAFARNIVSGRSLSLDEVATVLELGGLGVTAPLAAEDVGQPYPVGRPYQTEADAGG
jgi:HKD family nuclease